MSVSKGESQGLKAPCPLVPDWGQRDVSEAYIFEHDPEVLRLLLRDQTMTAEMTRKAGRETVANITWATDDYIREHPDDTRYAADGQILPELIASGPKVICPRVDKRLEEQRRRSVEKAEVFTPSWVCNKQNNLVDAAWFGRKDNLFNVEYVERKTKCQTWNTTTKPLVFKHGRTWLEYVRACRLEVSCGEAPYLTSRYDTTTGEWIDPRNRIGLLDRKLRVITENAIDETEWLNLAGEALQSCYGFDWQGDNILLARENLLYTVLEHYESAYGELAGNLKAVPPSVQTIRHWAEILSWNVWQMDGIKFVVPNTCHPVEMPPRKNSSNEAMLPGFDLPTPAETAKTSTQMCEGCRKNLVAKHNGVRCLVRDWQTGTVSEFVPPFEFKPIARKEIPQ